MNLPEHILTKSSQVPGYERGLFRDHTGNYCEAEDMENIPGPLYNDQQKVPVLPVPDLKQTCDLFLRSSRPHVTEEEYENTKKAVSELLQEGGLGQELQRRLIARAEEMKKKRTSWLTEWWNQGAYLSYKDSVVWNVSYYLQFKDECTMAMKSPCRRAARFISHAIEFRKALISGKLTPDRDKGGKVWSNTQYKYLFNTCRIPGGGPNNSDVARTYAPDVFGHISVIRKGQFFSVQVVDESTGDSLPVDAIELQLVRAKEIADSNGWVSYPIGILTAENRDIWQQNRDALIATNHSNAVSLEMIQSSMFTVCLDDTSPVTREDCGRELIHSDGNNRYFDKSFQIVVFENGKMGYVGEHSMMDGTTTTRFVNDVLEKLHADAEAQSTVRSKGSKIKAPYAPKGQTALPQPESLPFQLDTNLRQAIRKAQDWHLAVMATKELKVMMFHNFGKDAIKKLRMSPDAFIQMAIQLAYRMTFGYCRGTYESTATRRFLHGRTEVTRSVSLESEAFCDAVMQSEPIPEIYKKLVTATKAHSAYTKKASQGQGCDRHLMGLKMLVKSGERIPSLYSDPAYTRSTHWAISTSGLVGELMDGWGFGEVVPDGIGCGYSLGNNFIRVCVTSRHPREQWAHKMVTNLENALLLMKSVAESQTKSSKL